MVWVTTSFRRSSGSCTRSEVLPRHAIAVVRFGAATETVSRIFSGMTPTVLREGPFRLFFFSREEPRRHVHVAHPDGEAKFWLEPSVTLATQTGLSARQLAEAQDIVTRHFEEIRDAWIRHFGG